ncbi:sirohydrochlorin cobaltochelatase [uncultured Veillonella sp.]|uniref:sirohydrochlorin cobaltochelatase n=1 Tax=uncultured Veillonella sp. TaxID=159268 RepID=UPI0025E5AED2|nr:sirohydrochlorin cobaltochelatase [uncultured Veillonella sp.]MDY3973757.1 sirohydrochlorin cobaltochelatase [Veillonella caviae]
MSTKGIILATFGSIYGEAVEKSVGSMEAKIKKAYPDAIVRRVFLADALIEKWNDKYEVPVQSLNAALNDLKDKGVNDVFVLPFALVADQCYQKMRKAIAAFNYGSDRNAMRIHVGKPLLSSLGVKNYADDYVATIDAIMKHVNIRALNKSVLLMANGQNQLEFSALQLKCLYGNGQNVAVFTSNGFPNFKQALTLLERLDHKEVLVVPLALIGSEHLMDFLGGDRSDSVATLLTEEGYGVAIWNEGLGENPFIQELFLKHLAQSVRMIERKQQAVNQERSAAKANHLAV